MIKVKNYKCPTCGKVFQGLKVWGNHMEKDHPGEIPEGWTPARYFYYLQTGKSAGKCVICKRETEWNEGTYKYNRFCNDPKCREKYRDQFKNRMIGKYGKVTLLNDPDQQRKMIMQKKNSGYYDFPGGKVGYSSSYEFDFLKMCDSFLHMTAQDIMQPSPHTYYYEYKNPEDPENEGKKFYIPDYFIPSLNLEIEIKQNTSTHPKILKIDKVKEREKDEVMKTVEGINYIKINDKNYEEFFGLISKLRSEIQENTNMNKGESALESASSSNDRDEFASLYDMSIEGLLTWICQNIHFDKNDNGIKKPKDVVQTKYGDVHDVSYLIYRILRVTLVSGPLYQLATNLKHWVAVGYDSVHDKYRIETCYTFNTYEFQGKVVMLRTNWGNYNGLQVFDSYAAIKAFLVRAHVKNLLGVPGYPDLHIYNISDIAKPGFTIAQVVETASKNNVESIDDVEMGATVSSRRRGTEVLDNFTSIDMTAENKPLYAPLEAVQFNKSCRGEMFITSTNELVAFYVVQTNHVKKQQWITYIWVQPAYSGKGLGTQILDRILRTTPELWTIVPKNRTDLVQSYSHYGFKLLTETDDGYIMHYSNNIGNTMT